MWPTWNWGNNIKMIIRMRVRLKMTHTRATQKESRKECWQVLMNHLWKRRYLVMMIFRNLKIQLQFLKVVPQIESQSAVLALTSRDPISTTKKTFRSSKGLSSWSRYKSHKMQKESHRMKTFKFFQFVTKTWARGLSTRLLLTQMDPSLSVSVLAATLLHQQF